MRLRTPKLDFIVIGAQKAGTTSLWRYLEDNPRLRMPPYKEAPFFSEPTYPDELRGYMRALFKDAPARAKLGTVTPTYMLGAPGVGVPQIAERIHATVPDVRLVALLRDPVERAFSAYRMAVGILGERRSFREAIAEQLAPAALESARRGAAPIDSYVIGGEYGRILEAYLDRFPGEQLHVELTTTLEREPGEVVRRVCEFVGVEPHRPARLGERFYAGGRPRLSGAAEADLKDYLARNVWPRMRHSDQHREAFEFWFRLWNTEPSPAAETVDADSAERLREHYAEDALVLEAVTGVTASWLDS